MVNCGIEDKICAILFDIDKINFLSKTGLFTICNCLHISQFSGSYCTLISVPDTVRMLWLGLKIQKQPRRSDKHIHSDSQPNCTKIYIFRFSTQLYKYIYSDSQPNCTNIYSDSQPNCTKIYIQILNPTIQKYLF